VSAQHKSSLEVPYMDGKQATNSALSGLVFEGCLASTVDAQTARLAVHKSLLNDVYYFSLNTIEICKLLIVINQQVSAVPDKPARRAASR